MAVLSGKGGDNTRHADRLPSGCPAPIALTSSGGSSTCVTRTSYPQRTLDRLKKSSTVYLLKRRELENYLLDRDAIASVLDSLVPEGEEPPTPEQVDALIGQAAERLRRKIVINRVCRQSGPSEPLVGNSLRSELASAGADREIVATKVVSRMMTADDLQSRFAKLWAEAREMSTVPKVRGCSRSTQARRSSTQFFSVLQCGNIISAETGQQLQVQ